MSNPGVARVTAENLTYQVTRNRALSQSFQMSCHCPESADKIFLRVCSPSSAGLRLTKELPPQVVYRASCGTRLNTADLYGPQFDKNQTHSK